MLGSNINDHNSSVRNVPVTTMLMETISLLKSIFHGSKGKESSSWYESFRNQLTVSTAGKTIE
jgi:hypothetical protein